MIIFGEGDHYDIERLVAIWESGWERLDEFDQQYALCDRGWLSGNKSNCPTGRVLLGFEEVCNDMIADATNLRIKDDFLPSQLLGFAAKRKSRSKSIVGLPKDLHHGGSSKDDAKLRKLLEKVISSFTNSVTIGEAFSRIGLRKESGDFFPDIYSEYPLGELDYILIKDQWAEAMKWLLYGLESEKACDEAWWNCVWLYAYTTIEEMLDIKRLIERDVPLENKQLAIINKYLSYGIPIIDELTLQRGNKNLGQTYDICLEPRHYEIEGSSISIAAKMLLIRPAFTLAKQLQRKCAKPRFIRQCRAPSCGKVFYTGRKDAKSCPGSQGYKKNKCALEWVRYKRYLTKTGKNPERNWDNEQLKKAFISYDKR